MICSLLLFPARGYAYSQDSRMKKTSETELQLTVVTTAVTKYARCMMDIGV